MKPITPPALPGTSPIVFGVNQPEYEPLPARRSRGYRVITEWDADEAENQALIEAGPNVRVHVRVHQLTAGKPLQPIRLELVIVPPPTETEKD